MNVALSGASGFIGQAIVRRALGMGWTVKVIDRDSFNLPDDQFLKEKIEGTDAIINLAGAPIAKRWTPEYKQLIMESRVTTTRKIAHAITRASQKPLVFISTSAIGIYDSINTHDETSSDYAGSYLAKVCSAWEQEAMKAADSTRLVIFRIGVVLGRDGGALSKMYLPFSIGLGGKIGDGSQPVSFIHIDDLIEAMIFAMENPALSGIVNAVTPFPTNNADFTDKLGKVLKQPAWFTIPAFAMKIAYGEGAQILLEGQKVIPVKLMQAGFRFKYPTMQNALMQIYR